MCGKTFFSSSIVSDFLVLSLKRNKRLSFIVGVNVVLNRTVVVDSG